MDQNAEFEEGVELVLHELWRTGAGGRLCLGDGGRGALLHQTIQRGLLGAMTLMVDRGAVGRPLARPIQPGKAHLTGAGFDEAL